LAFGTTALWKITSAKHSVSHRVCSFLYYKQHYTPPYQNKE